VSSIAECARLTLQVRGEVDELCAYVVTHQCLAEAIASNASDKHIVGIARGLDVLRKEMQ
jgi:hypothetical protein